MSLQEDTGEGRAIAGLAAAPSQQGETADKLQQVSGAKRLLLHFHPPNLPQGPLLWPLSSDTGEGILGNAVRPNQGDAR